MSTGIVATNGAEHFGTISVAMVTPFKKDGTVDLDAGVSLAGHLVEQGLDSLILAGTTGESPTTGASEKLDLLRAVRSELGDSVKLVAGAGSYDTAASVELAKASAEAGADSLLVVTPYYSRPSQEGLVQHFTTVADAVDIPICLYDIPSRSVIPIEQDTLRRLAEHPNIQAVKDAKGDIFHAMELIETTDLAWYSGDDPLNLPWLAAGATGFISVIGHVAAAELRALRNAYDAGDLAEARRIAVSLAPLQEAQARLGGVTFAKAALKLLGHDVGAPRLPILEPSDAEYEQLAHDLQRAGFLQ
ncbi:4-hydroxy-tetrahydrodipicolinate synthase [Corynebacterium sp. 320]|uniref:4-hydroxy-tetrahydrodipicolinate synthase n=1 Tax=Corynebacterium zhongnanshanii TaxID=2768834 RepID=A0ABQ6VG25_9CORY|nr:MULTISPECIES: 4-hydroxy-tetrahydrodipicolinate synthase [Corynebacterium]KAB1503776.1 4-hydroxy-tetrahydrodipicolinate synthase [Corynebacterium sp. 320]KAB1553124.1 4-hydroxy-tetrahydrodipicolinate synthase [Corynebacterium sp. 321]KAB1553658.1 4-hydroxy-tetrahydrodipicolinate synthase [Corynebacterium sp. 319]KAB3523372.1 4-hydroxy-tetrahydrodipicolinate synthase [Corynebacterium zhongnanshanii]KAB3527912.1 4-hydroxy-tetrahydrodipicolinate synthase [Corynebacterium sp. 250]